VPPFGGSKGTAWPTVNGAEGHQSALIRAIIRLLCDLQSARHPLFRQVAQVINPLKFVTERQRNNKETP